MSVTDEGVTNVGTITGRLRLDASDWNRTLNLAESKARELGTVDPTIDIDVHAADALAKLAAVDAAEEKLGGTTIRTTKSIAQASEANKTHASRIGLIAAAVITLIPLLGPLAGYAFGVAGALGAMGVAGILAIVGIKHAIEENTAVGKDYAAGLQILKGDLNSLGNTAATGMLASFHIAVSQINAAMPMLNAQVSTFTRQLGTTGNLVLAGVINAFRVLNPLFLTAGMYVQQLAAGFAGWTAGGGLQRFGDYAMQMLPRVAETLGALVSAAMNLIIALSPMGTVVLGALQGIANVLNFIMTVAGPAFAPLVGGALAAVGAFKLWGFVAPMLQAVAASMGAVGVATTIATGPIGWIVAAVAGLAAVFAISTVAMQDNTQAADSYAASLQTDAGAIGAATRAQLAKNLQDANAFEIGKKLGLSASTVTEAALGQKKAMDEVAAAVARANAESTTAINTGNHLATQTSAVTAAKSHQIAKNNALVDSINVQASAMQTEIDKYNEIQAAIDGTTIATEGELAARTAVAAQYGVSLSAYQNAIGANKQTEDQLAKTTAQMRLQNDAAGLLNNALTLLNGGSLGVAQAQTGAAAANNALTDSFARNGLAVNGNTKEAVANQQALQQQVTAAQQVAQAVAEQTDSSVAAIQSYKDQKAALEDQLRAQGNLNPEVQAYIDKLYDIANLKVPPTKLDVETAQAIAKIAVLKSWIDSIQGRSVMIDLNGKVSGSGRPGFASGGTIDAGTIGGVGSGTSDSNLVRVSKGEEITRAAAASAPGVRPLLKALSKDPAGTMQQLAAGQSRGTVEYHYHIDGKSFDEITLSHAMANRQSELSA